MNKISKKNKQEIYDAWHREIYQLNLERDIENFSFLHNKILNYLHITDKDRGKLLDVACGKGLFLRAIRDVNKNIELFGTDISSYAIDKAKKIVNGKFSVDDAEKLSYKSNLFDYITCLGGVEYFERPIKGIQEMVRVLKKDGTVIIFVPNLMFLGYVWLAFRYGTMPTHGGTSDEGQKIYDYNSEKFYTYRGWIDIIRSGGLEVIHTDRYDYLGRTRYATPALIKLYNSIFYKLIPFNLTYSFVFTCKKQSL